MVALYKTTQVSGEDGQVGLVDRLVENEKTGGPIGGPTVGPIDDLTDRQREVLNLIKEDNKLTKRRLAEKLDINISAAQGHLDILKEKGIIERIGGTRGYWKILISLT